jgi:MYXO-CTERM domain-containing protein
VTDGGCGCAIAGAPDRSSRGLSAIVLALFVAAARRRRGRRG